MNFKKRKKYRKMKQIVKNKLFQYGYKKYQLKLKK